MTTVTGELDTAQPAIPVHLQESLDRYVHDRIPTGGFLRAVLTNDLFGAYQHADPDSLAAMPEIMQYVYWQIPGNCWGNKARILEWLAGSAVTP